MAVKRKNSVRVVRVFHKNLPNNGKFSIHLQCYIKVRKNIREQFKRGRHNERLLPTENEIMGPV